MGRSALVDEVAAALERCSFGRDRDRLAEPPTLEDVYRVNTTRDGDPVYVPLVEVDLETTDEPDLDAAYRIAVEVVSAVHPVVRDEHVRQYDVVFAYGETSWWDWEGEQRRISLRPEEADRLSCDPGFEAAELRTHLEELDDGDDEIPPVAWGEPLDRWEHYSDDDWSWALLFGGAT